MKLNSILEFPVQLSITGKTKSGKSHLLRKIILPQIIHEYENVFIFSPTALLDRDWEKFILTLNKKNQKKVLLFSEFDSDAILKLIAEIGDNRLKGDLSRRLIICDDCTALYSQSKKDFFSQLAFKGRHYGLSYIFTSHKWNAINTLTRSNLGTKIFFRITNERELKTFLEDNKIYGISNQEFIDLFKNSTGDYKAFVIKSTNNGDEYFTISRDGNLIPIKL